MKAPAAIGSNGNSRRMYFTFPVSIYFSLSCGNVVSEKCAQCGQVIEAYSMMVTGAWSDPIMMSPSGPASARSAGEGLSSALAEPENNAATPLPRPVKAIVSGAAETTKWRRVNDKDASKFGNAECSAAAMWH